MSESECCISWSQSYNADNLVIPDKVKLADGSIKFLTLISPECFENDSELTGHLTIGNYVTYIDERAFYNCSALTGNLVIPNSVRILGRETFCKCIGFDGSLTIQNSVEHTGAFCFGLCYRFQTLIFNNFNTEPQNDNTSLFGNWNEYGGIVSVTGSYTMTWTSQDALNYAQIRGLPNTWTAEV
jgi:hypothetical protein